MASTVELAIPKLREARPGGISHLTPWDGDDCHNMDAWESEEVFNAFGESRLGAGSPCDTPAKRWSSSRSRFGYGRRKLWRGQRAVAQWRIR